MRHRGRQRCACGRGHGAIPYHVRNGRRMIVRHHEWEVSIEPDEPYGYRATTAHPSYEGLVGIGRTTSEAVDALLARAPFRYEGHNCLIILPEELSGKDEPATPLDLDVLDYWARGEGPAPWPEDE